MSPEEVSKYWRRGLLENDEGTQEASVFHHPGRESAFPDVYRLQEPHPLRPASFTPTNFPKCTRTSFNDYVLPIRKSTDFMESWKEVGEATATPCDDVSTNKQNGT